MSVESVESVEACSDPDFGPGQAAAPVLVVVVWESGNVRLNAV